MPRGEHFKKIDNQDIVDQFDRQIEKYGRKFFTASELAQNLNVSAGAVRQRLQQMKGDSVEAEELAGTTYWYKAGEEIWVTNASLFGLLTAPTTWRGKEAHPMDAPIRHLITNLRAFFATAALTFLTFGAWWITGAGWLAPLVLAFGFISFTIGLGEYLLLSPSNNLFRRMMGRIDDLHIWRYEQRRGGNQ